MGRSLCQCLSLTVKVSSSGIFHGQMQVSWVRRGNATQAPVFLTVYMTGFVCKLSYSCGKKGSISFSSENIRAVTKGAVEVRMLILTGGCYMATENYITQVAEAHWRKKIYLFSLSPLLSSFKNSINLGLSEFSIYFSYF